jgi:hypothetical protein
MKRTFFLIILLLYSYLSGQVANTSSLDDSLTIDNLIEQSISALSDSLQKFQAVKSNADELRQIDGFAIKFDKDMASDLSVEIIKKVATQIEKMFYNTSFNIYEIENIDNLLKQQSLQMEDIYSKAKPLEIGKFKQWKGLFLVSVGKREENNFGKRRLYLTINIELTNIETGGKIWSESVSSHYQKEQPAYLYFVGLLSLFILTFLLNIFTHGKRTKGIISVTFVLMIVYSVWFFFI